MPTQQQGITRVVGDKLRALCALSDISSPAHVTQLQAFIREAPDPETAIRRVLKQVEMSSEVLARKWRSLISELWSAQHPHVTPLPQLTLTAADLAATPLLNDAHAYLASLQQKPAKLYQDQREWLIDPTDVSRLMSKLPSLANTPKLAIESEWASVSSRRLRAILQAAHLVRALKGQLVPVQSRLKRFLSLPKTQQFYVLWHADAYHVVWSEFAGLWGQHMQIIQEYLPLLWETRTNLTSELVENRVAWSSDVIEAFAPLWDEEGLLQIKRGHSIALQIVQQHALPTIIDRFLLQDLLERHGLVTLSEEFGKISKFTWTEVGAAIFAAEGTQELPCAKELLDPRRARESVPAHPRLI